jgi:hypothetical protein
MPIASILRAGALSLEQVREYRAIFGRPGLDLKYGLLNSTHGLAVIDFQGGDVLDGLIAAL